MSVSTAKTQRASLPTVPAPLDPAVMLTRFSTKDREGFERQVKAAETKAGEAVAKRWRHLTAVLMAMADRPPKLTGTGTVQFFIPDGKHRRQVFALLAGDDGTLSVFTPNVLEEAIRAGIFAKPAKPSLTKPVDPNTYTISASGETLVIEPLDRDTPNPQFYFKDMTGWNRKAISIQLPPTASESQVRAAEQLCALAAVAWPAAGTTEPAKT